MHDIHDTSPPLSIEELRDRAFKMVADQYARNDKPDFDIVPVMFAFDDKNQLMVIMLQGGPPHEMIPVAIKQLSLQAYIFASAAFTRCPGSEESGECVVFTLETPTYSEMWLAKVTRAPLPVLGAVEQMQSFAGRMTHLLHQHTRN